MLLSTAALEEYRIEGFAPLGRAMNDERLVRMRAEETRIREFQPYEPLQIRASP